jgi:hypothetical protein
LSSSSPPTAFISLCHIAWSFEDAEEVISEFEQALSRAKPSLSHNAMETMYYSQVCIHTRYGNAMYSKNICNYLSERKVPLDSVAYVAVQNQLLFDHNQQICNALNSIATGNNLEQLETMNKKRVYYNNDTREPQFAGLAGQTLEQILLFLPVTSLAIVSLVCRLWHNKLPGKSVGYWQGLLDINNWSNAYNTEWQDRSYKHQTYLNHEAVPCCVELISKAATVLMTCKSNKNVACCCKRVRTSRGIDHFCHAIHIWSKDMVLTVYNEACEVRLFEAIWSDNEKRPQECKEIAHYVLETFSSGMFEDFGIWCSAIDNDHIALCCTPEAFDPFAGPMLLMCMSCE